LFTGILRMITGKIGGSIRIIVPYHPVSQTIDSYYNAYYVLVSHTSWRVRYFYKQLYRPPSTPLISALHRRGPSSKGRVGWASTW
jgi:hypothetical protein